MKARFLALWTTLPVALLVSGCSAGETPDVPVSTPARHATQPAGPRPDPSTAEKADLLTEGKPSAAPLKAEPSGFAPPTTSEKPIIKAIGDFLAADDPAARAKIAQQIEAMPDYTPRSVGRWLHLAHAAQCQAAEPVKPGLIDYTVDTVLGENRTLTVRIPEGYTPTKAWPLVYAYHPTGGTGPQMIRMVTQALGAQAERMILAAPTDYTPLNVDSKRSWKPEQRALLRFLRMKLHLDSDRTYAVGFSQGGYAAWSAATFYGDELAASSPVGSTFDAAPEIPGLWECLFANSSPVPILNIWGENDTLAVLGLDIQTQRGTVRELNERVVALTKQAPRDITNARIPGGGHEFRLPITRWRELLTRCRTAWPAEIEQHFRYLNQARAGWLEGLRWEGAQWGLTPISVDKKEAETDEQAFARALLPRLGSLKGVRRGQNVDVEFTHLDDLMVWFGEGMVDWTQPVKITSNGRSLYTGQIRPSLLICLTEAARTRDFERLRWAGVRIRDPKGDGKNTGMMSAAVWRAEEPLPVYVEGKPR